jgi:hypothetical protein
MGRHWYGWDYLRTRFLVAASADNCLTDPSKWSVLQPEELSALYRSSEAGLTLNRVNERTFLLNELGRHLLSAKAATVTELFEGCDRTLGGETGFLSVLSKTVAYSDPVAKKSSFFTSLAISQCGWSPLDSHVLQSPIDYHEMRGHLRIGTVVVTDASLSSKLTHSVPLSEDEDAELRSELQKANDMIAAFAGVSSSVLHYLLWNVFRNCCPRPSGATHCMSCGPACHLPDEYKAMPTYHRQCIFSPICNSASLPIKVSEPPYIGHFY